MEDLDVDAFSNFLVDYRLTGFGIFIVHRKAYLLTSRDAFLRTCGRYSDQIGEMYRYDKDVSVKALVENSTIRTNESLRNFVYNALNLTVKECVERHSCWQFLWEGNPKSPKPEPQVHPLINSYLRTVLGMKGIRVSREPRMANGYLKKEEMPGLVAQINASGGKILFVALGSPKQEQWIQKWLPQLNVGICQGIGGTLDTIVGTVKRAPAFFCRFGLEWFYRLITNPKRIRRQIVLPVFAWLVIKEKFLK